MTAVNSESESECSEYSNKRMGGKFITSGKKLEKIYNKVKPGIPGDLAEMQYWSMFDVSKNITPNM